MKKKVDRTRRYSDQEIDRALLELALCSGSVRRASANLKAQGIKVPASTMVRWRDELHVERYEMLKATAAPQVEERLIEHLRANALRTSEVQRDAIEAVAADLAAGKMDGAGAAKAAKDLGISNTGIGIEKMLLLQSRPTSIEEHRDVGDLIEELHELMPNLGISRRRGDIEGVAIDVSPQLPKGVEPPPAVERPDG